MRMKSSGSWLAGVCLAFSSAMGAPEPPLVLEWGALDTAGEGQQSAFRLLKTSETAPVTQRVGARGTAPWIVQSQDVVRDEWVKALETAGAVVRGYLPVNALLVEASSAVAPKIAALEGVAWMGEYLPAYKKSPAWPKVADEERECVVTVFDAADKRRVAREFGEMNVFVPRAQLEADGTTFRVHLTAAQIADVAEWAEVEWIEPAAEFRSWGGPVPDEPAAADGVAAELRQAYDAGERVVALRRGAADAGAYGAAARAVDSFVHAHPDLLVAAAAGNAAVDLDPADGIVDAGSIGSPATAKNVLSVGAAEGRTDVARAWRDSWPEDFAVEPIALDRMAQAGGPQGLAAFSGRGPCSDGRTKPDLVAPGTYVAVPRPADSDFTGWGVVEGNPNQIHVGGTGMAAEQAADAARQARQWLIEQRGLSAPSAALVKALLMAGARDLAPGQYGTGAKREIPGARPNNAQGAGLLDPAGAFPPDDDGLLGIHDAQGLATGAADVYELAVDRSGGRFVLVLSYADPAAAPCAGQQLVNDLDLTVRKPSGELLHANGRTAPDPVNNVEMIEFEADEAGTHLARVEARAVPWGGSQPYALVVRGPRTEAAPAAASEQP